MATQQNIVYFLGAGCSYNFGYPLTKDIMPAILQRLQAGNLFLSDYEGRSKADADLEQRLLGYIQLVYPGLGNGSGGPEVPNITEIFSFVDHLCFYDTPHHPSLGGDRLLDCRALLNRALGELLQWYEYNHKPTYEQKVLHRQFIASIRQEIKNGHSVTVITTNYDLTVDNFFVQEAQHNKIDFGIPYRDVDDSRLIIQPTEPVLRYYKLHGSLNWLMCSLCGQYYINPIGSIVHQAYRQEVDDNNTCECNKKMPLKPVLVPPSLVRDVRDPNLLQVWKGALESIRHADRLIMIGYSMPAEDLAIKSVILRGINGRNKDAPALEVVQYGDAAKPNYRNIFGGIFRESQYYPTGLAPYLMENHPALFTV